jgi:hypothetical protein
MSDKSLTSENKIKKPIKLPPIKIPPKNKKHNRNVFNSFFPEPHRTNKLIKINLICEAKNNELKLRDELKIYKEVLHVFVNLQEGEKLGKEQKLEENKPKISERIKPPLIDEIKSSSSDDINSEILENNFKKKYYKQQPYHGLWITRWWYSEGREKTIEYLDEDFAKFMNYLDRIIENTNNDPTGIFVSLINNIREFTNSIITGLYNLKQTYSEYVKMVAKVDSIILTLLDFKEKTDIYLGKHNQNIRLTIKSKSRPIKTSVPVIYDNVPSNSV